MQASVISKSVETVAVTVATFPMAGGESNVTVIRTGGGGLANAAAAGASRQTAIRSIRVGRIVIVGLA